MTPSLPRKVLVVEDEPLVRLMATEILSDAGFSVLVASTADEALALVDASISALVTDIEMPGSLDGIELAQTIAAQWPAIAVVVASGRNFPKTHDLPRGTIFLSKPYTASRLVNVVAALV